MKLISFYISRIEILVAQLNIELSISSILLQVVFYYSIRNSHQSYHTDHIWSQCNFQHDEAEDKLIIRKHFASIFQDTPRRDKEAAKMPRKCCHETAIYYISTGVEIREDTSVSYHSQ